MLMESHRRWTEPTTQDESCRRGPLRPEQLVSVRQRQSRRLAGHRFRAVDTVFLLVVPTLLLRHALGRPVGEMTLADVAPVVIGVWTMWWLLRTLGTYRLGRSDGLPGHLARVGVAAVGSAAAAVLVGVVSPVRPDAVRRHARAGCGLCRRHRRPPRRSGGASWLAGVAAGLLTPNLVVVGATNHAEDLIATALERRDMTILGVFDDRAERSPLAMLGVPVLGTTQAMLRHRVMPYVDLVVVAIDPVGDDPRAPDHGSARRAAEHDHDAVRRPGRQPTGGGDRPPRRCTARTAAPARRRPQSGRQARPGPRDRRPRCRHPGSVAGPHRSGDSHRQSWTDLLPSAPARVQQRGDRRVEVPHDAPRRRRRSRRAAGDRRRRPGHPSRSIPPQDEPRRAAAAAQRHHAARCRWSALAPMRSG